MAQLVSKRATTTMLQLGHSHQVLNSYRTLLRLISRLPKAQRESAFREARTTTKSRKDDTNPESCLAYLKEMAAKIGYLRIVTPKRHGDVTQATYVMRDGKLVEGHGHDKGTRWGHG